MLDEGRDAPTFALPGVVDGEGRTVDLGAAVGDRILIVVFYPGDFNPACDGTESDLSELDLLNMQRDVDVYAVSTDSVFSHRAFAEEYGLSLPLVSDTHGEAVEAYDVALEGEQLLAQRAVFVVDHDGVIDYAWATDDLRRPPDMDAIRAAVATIGGDSTAVGRYRVGHAHYVEGRRAFTSAMDSYEAQDWLIARGDFERAMEEFQEAGEEFHGAVRFAESDALEQGFERADRKATALWQAAEWLAASADEYGSGNGEEADGYRRDAEKPLETARDIGEPPDPEEIDLDAAGAPTAEAADEADAEFETPADPEESTTATRPEPDVDGASGEGDVDAAVEAVETGDALPGEDGDQSAEDDSTAGTAEDTGGDVELDLDDPTE